MTTSNSQPSAVPSDTKWAFTTRRVDKSDVVGLSMDLGFAVSGDLVLARVTDIGHHKKLQLAEGRPSETYVGDHVVLACGDRYAPDQFEGVAELDSEGADLLAGGGLIGRMRHANERMAPPTRLKPLGLLVDDDGELLNIARYALPARTPSSAITVIGVVGASMNAG
ncbi:MAG: DUF1611 domain-containing protein, partial [Sphingomonadales bacterium]|nr:DUF1611 domain-containing protein [Sphingomonadales bacterium]